VTSPSTTVSKSTRIALGAEGEERVIAYLREKGLTIVERNFRCPLGEIDIIAQHSRLLVFVEVRTRTSTRFGSPLESVDARKQRRLSRLAQYYLKVKGEGERSARFDVVGVTKTESGDWVIEWVPDAFDLCA